MILSPYSIWYGDRILKRMDEKILKFAAPCLFGLEGILGNELRAMDAQNVLPENGRVLFEGTDDMLARANLCSRYAERILIVAGSFEAKTFTELFDGVKQIEWERFIGKDDAFPVKGWALQSVLHSIPDCQSIIKKAMVERLKSRYKIEWFSETATKYQIQFSILKNQVTVMIDTSGEGLHKRGYRGTATAAPIKETLAAAMAYLSRIYPDTVLFDPFCGSGTVLIESALIANNIAPGLKRGFSAEAFAWMDQSAWSRERQRALAEVKRSRDFVAVGSDIDPHALEIAARNAKLAGVSGSIEWKTANAADFSADGPKGLVITNPPYGERLLDIRSAEALYKVMGERFLKRRGWRYNIISPHPEFEAFYGRAADKRRKMYNGMIPCQLYQYFKV